MYENTLRTERVTINTVIPAATSPLMALIILSFIAHHGWRLFLILFCVYALKALIKSSGSKKSSEIAMTPHPKSAAGDDDENFKISSMTLKLIDVRFLSLFFCVCSKEEIRLSFLHLMMTIKID